MPCNHVILLEDNNCNNIVYGPILHVDFVSGTLKCLGCIWESVLRWNLTKPFLLLYLTNQVEKPVGRKDLNSTDYMQILT